MSTTFQPENINNLLATRFVFRMPRAAITTYYCQTAELPGVNISVVNQPTSFNQIKRPGGAVEHGTLNIKFMVDEDLKNWNEIFAWIRQCSDYVDFDEYAGPEEHLSDTCELLILSNTNNPKYKISFAGLFPLSLGSLQFDSTKDASEYMLSTASFVFTSMKFVDLNLRP